MRKIKDKIFCVQKHRASHLHYDFRLEIGGVLKSWAVPKGPSSNPEDKRLAMMVDDHDLNYADFEGRISAGSYGAGAVLLWDIGTYECISDDGDVKESLKKGRIEIEMNGKKMKGKYALVKIKLREKEKGKPWLLFKIRGDEYDNKSYKDEEKSVKSGKKIEEI